jgi:prepilin-type processing-associated H-X9-DG protein
MQDFDVNTVCTSQFRQRCASFQAVAGSKPSSDRKSGGYWGFLTYAQNYLINPGRVDMGLRHVQRPVLTIMFGETQGYDALLYPDPHAIANVCYRHSGGSDHSVFYDMYGMKNAKRGRANVVFLDSHVELRRNTSNDVFTVTKYQ